MAGLGTLTIAADPELVELLKRFYRDAETIKESLGQPSSSANRFKPDMKTLRDAFAKMHDRAMGDDSIVYMSIPPRPEVDADLLLHAALDELDAARKRLAVLEGITPELASATSEGELPRYSVRWNGPQLPLAVPMPDGYWTPWHLADEARVSSLKEFGRYLAALVRDNASPRTTDDELDAMVDEALTAHGEAKWLEGTARRCQSCSRCWDVPCGGCQAGGICDAHCHCDESSAGRPSDEDEDEEVSE
ncbi:MAG: hypothetical protein DI536_29030 [Archangium gephyra]|uniref:Uncharacterized protein n=1 Tax=Archangium gephyra TaxID=48 RepID=A0A2W5T2K6_9BACT|nr:MAG: hypothetical protein DI536_29030 [Archangium gephyra]